MQIQLLLELLGCNWLGVLPHRRPASWGILRPPSIWLSMEVTPWYASDRFAPKSRACANSAQCGMPYHGQQHHFGACKDAMSSCCSAGSRSWFGKDALA